MVVIAKPHDRLTSKPSRVNFPAIFKSVGEASQESYLRPRYYSPSTGQFNKVDPFAGNFEDPQSLHKYTYAHDDPVNNIDPSGNFIFTLGALLLGAGGLTGLSFAAVFVSTIVLDLVLLDFFLTFGRASLRPQGVNFPLSNTELIDIEYFGPGTSLSPIEVRQSIGSPRFTSLPKNASLVKAQQGKNVSVKRNAVGNRYVGTDGCGPCVGLVIITPDDIHAFHFDALNDPYLTLRFFDPQFPPGSRAVVTQATDGSESTSQARHTLYRTIEYLERNANITLDGFVGPSSVWVDNDGNYFK